MNSLLTAFLLLLFIYLVIYLLREGSKKNVDKQSCHSCMRHSALTCSINPPSEQFQSYAPEMN